MVGVEMVLVMERVLVLAMGRKLAMEKVLLVEAGVGDGAECWRGGSCSWCWC